MSDSISAPSDDDTRIWSSIVDLHVRAPSHRDMSRRLEATHSARVPGYGGRQLPLAHRLTPCWRPQCVASRRTSGARRRGIRGPSAQRRGSSKSTPPTVWSSIPPSRALPPALPGTTRGGTDSESRKHGDCVDGNNDRDGSIKFLRPTRNCTAQEGE